MRNLDSTGTLPTELGNLVNMKSFFYVSDVDTSAGKMSGVLPTGEGVGVGGGGGSVGNQRGGPGFYSPCSPGLRRLCPAQSLAA